MSLRHHCLLRVAPFLIVAASLRAQTNAPNTASDLPTIRSKVSVVLVDVVVTQAKGEPAPGLEEKDFQILEDGKKQTISFFEEHKGAAPSPVNLPPMPPHVFANNPAIQTSDSTNVLLLDWLNTQPQDQPYVRAQIIKYLRGMSPGTRMAIFTLGSRLHLVQGFTSDPSGLLAALDNEKAGAETQSSPLLPTAQQNAADQGIIELMIMNQAAPSAVQAVRQEMADSAGSQSDARIRITLRALQQLARYLSRIPGRKNVIWFSGSFPISIFPDAGTPRQYQRNVQQTADEFTADQVAVYPVAAVGLVGEAAFDPTMGSTTRSQRVDLRGANSSGIADQIAMESLAKDTGGHAFYDTNGLTAAVSHAIEDGSHYYTLTYTPTNAAMDGKYRRIQLKLSGGKYKLDYRRGYYADDTKTEQAADQTPEGDALLPLMGFGMPDFAQIVYKARVQPSNPQPGPGAVRAGSNAGLKGPVTRYGVDFAIAARDLRLEASPDGVRRGHIEVMIVAYDPNGKPLNLMVAKYGVALPPQAYVDAQQQGLQVRGEIDVPSGEVFLRTGIYDLNSHAAGTLGIPLNETASLVAPAK
ncbi:MAG: VWA domain-containing protein [Candidatus Acidiferrum sp.]